MYDKNTGLDICNVCGEYIIDGYCDCDSVPDWDGMVAIARRDYAAGYYDFDGTFAEFLAWKDFPPEVIESALGRG